MTTGSEFGSGGDGWVRGSDARKIAGQKPLQRRWRTDSELTHEATLVMFQFLFFFYEKVAFFLTHASRMANLRGEERVQNKRELTCSTCHRMNSRLLKSIILIQCVKRSHHIRRESLEIFTLIKKEKYTIEFYEDLTV